MKGSVVYLGTFETGFYFGAWIIGVLYSIYKVHLISYYFEDYDSSYEDFKPGWSWIGGKRDTADVEWAAWIPFMYGLFPWIVIHLMISQVLKYTRNSTIICSWYLSISIFFLWTYIGILGILCMLIQPCIACLLVSFRSKTISYIVHLLLLGVIHLTSSLHVATQEWLGLDDKKYSLFVVSICWMQMRSISCTIDRIDSYEHTDLKGFFKDFIQSAAYCLYLPTLFLGPLILYSEFIDGVEKEPSEWTITRVKKFVLNILRYLFWLRFTEFAMHFVYFNALTYHPKVVAELEPWAFYGFGYCMGQYFFNKYVVVYGIVGEFSRADDIAAPHHPKCIGRIHLYSDMWKHFDRGLYNFLVRYIYVPICSTKIPQAKLVASFSSFAFVFLWHGMELFIFVWSFLNFLGLTIEGIAKSLAETPSYIAFRSKYLTRRNNRRFNCVLATPLLALGAVSNFYFFAGTEIGNSFIYRLFHDSYTAIGILMFLLYCCCQVSTDVKNWEQKRSQILSGDPRNICQD